MVADFTKADSSRSRCTTPRSGRAAIAEAVENGIHDELRQAQHRPEATELDADLPDASVSPLDAAIGVEAVERDEGALGTLRPDERELIIAGWITESRRGRARAPAGASRPPPGSSCSRGPA